MPQLPSGRHVSIDPKPAQDVLRHYDNPGNVHHILSVKSITDLLPYLEVNYLVPASEASEIDIEIIYGDEVPQNERLLPEGLFIHRSGYTIMQLKECAVDWPDEDVKFFIDFFAERGEKFYQYLVDDFLAVAEVLRSSDASFLQKTLSGWYDAGVHPAQVDD